MTPLFWDVRSRQAIRKQKLIHPAQWDELCIRAHAKNDGLIMKLIYQVIKINFR